MAEEKKVTSKVKIKLGENWIFAGTGNYRKGETVEVEPEIYESMKNAVKHEVVK